MRGRGLTTASLARQAGVSKGALWSLFDGHTRSPTVATLEKILPVLGLSVHGFLEEKDEFTPEDSGRLFGDMLMAMRVNGTIELDDDDILEAAKCMADAAEIRVESGIEEAGEHVRASAARIERRRQRRLRRSL